MMFKTAFEIKFVTTVLAIHLILSNLGLFKYFRDAAVPYFDMSTTYMQIIALIGAVFLTAMINVVIWQFELFDKLKQTKFGAWLYEVSIFCATNGYALLTMLIAFITYVGLSLYIRHRLYLDLNLMALIICFGYTMQAKKDKSQ